MGTAPAYDVAVVGLGAMGSATAYQLARRGASVLGIDQFEPPHTLGSTHGDSRVTRLATAEGAAYVPLVTRSHELWREIEAGTGSELFTACGVLMVGPGPGSAGAGLHGVADWVGTTIDIARSAGIDHEVLDGTEVARRHPMFELDADCIAYYEPGGGYVHPEAAVAAQLALAQRHGATLRLGERVAAITPTPGGGAALTVAGERVHVGHVVLAAGAWNPTFLRDPNFSSLLTVRRQVLHWFEVAPGWGDAVAPGPCPVYICAFGASAADCFYGFPAIDGSAGGMKAASEQATDATTADTADRSTSPAEARALHDRLLAPRLRAVTPRCLRSAVCLYTVTPDSGFIIDVHPELDDVTLVSPCSGHGFKHSAAIGEALAQRIVDGQSNIDLSPFRLGRFQR